MRRSMLRKTLQLLHALPDPAPIAGVIVLVVAFGSMASCAERAKAEEVPTAPLMVFSQGEFVHCGSAGGCIAMTREALQVLLEEAERRPCRRQAV